MQMVRFLFRGGVLVGGASSDVQDCKLLRGADEPGN